MNKNLLNILLINCKRYVLVFAAILLVLLTSCALKTSIKNLSGIPTNTELNFSKGNANFSSSILENCSQLNFEDTQIVKKVSFTDNDLLPAVIFTLAFLLTSGFHPFRKENKHPFYSGSRKIPSSIPLFLEYQKLIIHNTY